MKWGVRRYQNPDGTLTHEGKKRYGVSHNGWFSEEGKKKLSADLRKIESKNFRNLERNRKMRYFRSLPKNEQQKSYDTQIQAIYGTKQRVRLQKQERVEGEYARMKKVLVEINQNPSREHEIGIYVNKYGNMQFMAKDPQFRKFSLNGYEAVKSIEDIMKIVKI